MLHITIVSFSQILIKIHLNSLFSLQTNFWHSELTVVNVMLKGNNFALKVRKYKDKLGWLLRLVFMTCF